MFKNFIDVIDFTVNRSFDRKKTVINHSKKLVSILRDGPIDKSLICNSIPKSGTHLVEKVVEHCTPFEKSGYFFSEHQRGRIFKNYGDYLATLKRIRTGYSSGAHMPYSPTNEAVLTELGLKHILLVRDPRAVLVSQYFHILNRPTNISHRTLSARKTTLEGLQMLIDGFCIENSNQTVAPFAEYYESYAGWAVTGSLVIRYEDLVGRLGGGDAGKQIEVIENILRYSCDSELIHEVSVDIENILYDKSSNTFRSGTIDGWRKTFDHLEVDFLDQKLSGVGTAFGY